MITVSAPGKLMLLGEHAVVYGQPCLVTAVDRRLSVGVEISGDKSIQINSPGASDTRFVEAAVSEFFKTTKLDNPGLHITTKSEFETSLGFGSSAAVTGATVKALSLVMQKSLTDGEIFDIAYKAVYLVQGLGSGFDVAASVWGGTLYFVTGGKAVEPLAADNMPLIVGYSGVKADTTTMVKMVAEKKKKFPEKVDRIFQAIGKLVNQAKEAMVTGDWGRVGKLMDFNQEYLRDLGVSTQKLEDMISAARAAGAWGAKLSGAGGGDCMIALYPQGIQGKSTIAGAIQEAGGQVIDVGAGAEGVKIEQADNKSV